MGSRPPRGAADISPFEDEALWRGLVEQLPAVIYVADFDEKGTLQWLSPRVRDLLGHPAEAFLADDELWYTMIHPDDVARVRAEEARVHRDVEPFDCEYRMRSADGRDIVVWERDAILTSDDGERRWTQGVVLDITAQRHAELHAREEQARAQRYLDLARTVIVTLDHAARVVLVNRSGHDLLGLAPGQLTGRDFFDAVLAEPDRAVVRRQFEAVMGGAQPATGKLQRVIDAAGVGHEVVWDATALRDDAGAVSGLLLTGLDVTDRRHAEQMASFLARHDHLTGLPNRATLVEELERTLAAAARTQSPVGVITLDIDEFSLVNDSLGHAGGDALLAQVASRLRTLRGPNDVLARTGSDEFCVLVARLDGPPAEAAEALAHAYAELLAPPFDVEHAVFDVSVSAGFCVFPADGLDADALMRHADAALHAAKGLSARPRVARFRAASEPRRPLSLTAQLRRAMARDELVLHWQPIVDLTGDELRAAEALVRWDDGRGQLLQPREFVSFAEETGLIEELDFCVLELACAQVRAWRELDFAPLISVNVSPRALQSADYPARVAGQLAGAGVDPGRVVLELTESAILGEAGAVGAVLDGLFEVGVLLALDDFGAGYSSLARLVELPVDFLKVDRSLVHRLTGHGGAGAIVRTVAELAASLRMTAVLEGIETEEQRALVAGLPGVLAQGFLLGRPAPADALTSWAAA